MMRSDPYNIKTDISEQKQYGYSRCYSVAVIHVKILRLKQHLSNHTQRAGDFTLDGTHRVNRKMRYTLRFVKIVENKE